MTPWEKHKKKLEEKYGLAGHPKAAKLYELASYIGNVDVRHEPAPEKATGEIMMQNERNEEPLNCPFCGCKPKVRGWHGGGPQKAIVTCEHERCPAGPAVIEQTRAKAIKKWNTRADVSREKNIPLENPTIIAVDRLGAIRFVMQQNLSPGNKLTLIGWILK